MVHTRRLTADRLLVRLEYGQKGGATMKRLLDWQNWCDKATYLANCNLDQLDRAMKVLTPLKKSQLHAQATNGTRGPGRLPRRVRAALTKIIKKENHR